MHPHAFEPQAVQPAGLARLVEHAGQRERLRRRAVEQRGRQDRRAGIDIGRDLLLAALLQPAVRRHGEVAAPGIADAGCDRRQQQQRVHGAGIERLGEPRQVGRHAVDPDGVGVDVEERLAAELRQCLDHAAAGVEQLGALVGNHDLRPGARCNVPFDLVGEVVHVDHGALDAGGGEPVEHEVEHRLAARPSPAASASCW